jgi:hypothetical protein
MNAKLPREYVPIIPSKLKVGTEYGPIEFIIKSQTHEKSRELLEKSDTNQQTRIATPYLFPSEMWGLARVLAVYFGRLNECAITRAKWQLYSTASQNQKLTARSKVKGIHTRNKLPFATVETKTMDDNGNTLMCCLDEFLMLHDVHQPFYREQNKEKEIPENLAYDRTRKVYFRHVWDDGNWNNNIHTDEYARRFGYKRGLPEFIMYVDWIFLSQLEQSGADAYSNTVLDLKKILPIYKNETIRIVETKSLQSSIVQFFRGKQERVLAEIKQNERKHF